MFGKTGENNWRAFFNPISHFICTNITERTGKGNNVPTYVVAYSMYLLSIIYICIKERHNRVQSLLN